MKLILIVLIPLLAGCAHVGRKCPACPVISSCADAKEQPAAGTPGSLLYRGKLYILVE